MRNFSTQNKFIHIGPMIYLCCLLLLGGCDSPAEFEETTQPSKEEPIVVQNNLHPYSIALEINDKWYSGEEILYDSINEQYYFSPVSIAPYLDCTIRCEAGGVYYWNGTPIEQKEDDPKTVKYQDLLYLSEDYLTDDLGLNIYKHNNEIYIDNYPKLDYSWVKYRTVFHSCGSINHEAYTNSYEALKQTYADGGRLFEVDLLLTTDQIPICGHDWKRVYDLLGLPEAKTNALGKPLNPKTASKEELYPPLSYDEFIHYRDLCEDFTLITYEELLEFMEAHEDMYIITDTKDVEEAAIRRMFKRLISMAKSKDSDVLNRIIPQIYNNQMGDILFELNDWNSMIYTFYQMDPYDHYGDIYTYARTHGIKVFTTTLFKADPIFINPMVDRGAYIYLHTLNKMEEVEDSLVSSRSYGIYTDYLPSDCLDDFPCP